MCCPFLFHLNSLLTSFRAAGAGTPSPPSLPILPRTGQFSYLSTPPSVLFGFWCRLFLLVSMRIPSRKCFSLQLDFSFSRPPSFEEKFSGSLFFCSNAAPALIDVYVPFAIGGFVARDPRWKFTSPPPYMPDDGPRYCLSPSVTCSSVPHRFRL